MDHAATAIEWIYLGIFGIPYSIHCMLYVDYRLYPKGVVHVRRGPRVAMERNTMD